MRETDRVRSGHQALAAGLEAFEQGEPERALEAFGESLEWATEHHDQGLWDRAYCNRSALEIESGRIPERVGELRRIVLRSWDAETGFLAAYTVSRAYELDRDYERALFYARIARDRGLKLKRRAWLASSHNQIGNLLLAQSYFEEAGDEYGLALGLTSIEPSINRALMLDNLGYCRFIQGRYSEGFTHVVECLRALGRFRAHRFRAAPELTLSYGYLEINKLRPARRHAEKALELSEQFGDETSLKNAHFLLGEIYHQLGQSELAREFFTRLQERYYPGAHHVPELLMAIDVRSLVNLKA